MAEISKRFLSRTWADVATRKGISGADYFLILPVELRTKILKDVDLGGLTRFVLSCRKMCQAYGIRAIYQPRMDQNYRLIRGKANGYTKFVAKNSPAVRACLDGTQKYYLWFFSAVFNRVSGRDLEEIAGTKDVTGISRALKFLSTSRMENYTMAICLILQMDNVALYTPMFQRADAIFRNDEDIISTVDYCLRREKYPAFRLLLELVGKLERNTVIVIYRKFFRYLDEKSLALLEGGQIPIREQYIADIIEVSFLSRSVYVHRARQYLFGKYGHPSQLSMVYSLLSTDLAEYGYYPDQERRIWVRNAWKSSNVKAKLFTP